MIQGNQTTRRTLAIAVAVITLAALNGCGRTHATAHNDPATQAGQALMLADAALGAGDSLGSQVFSEQAGSSEGFAVLDTAEQAFALAIAEADADEPSTPDAVVGVQVPTD